MSKALYCALAMLIGAAIGGNAPQEWRGDASRYAKIAMSDQAAQTRDVALVYRPYQPGD